MAHIIDSKFYGNGFATPSARAVFDDETRFKRWLDIEAALATVQGELGVIPKEAATEIAARATLDNVDLERVRAGIEKTNHSLVPLLKEIQQSCDGDLGEWIHYGATTQDIHGKPVWRRGDPERAPSRPRDDSGAGGATHPGQGRIVYNAPQTKPRNL